MDFAARIPLLMADQLETLKQLQQLDAEIFQLRKSQQDKPRELEAANARLAAQEARLKAVEDRLKTLQLSLKEKEIELQTREANVKKLQGQLFQVKTNKEYSTMQHEIDVLKADNSLLEEAVLKTFDAIDQASKERQQQQQRFAEEQAHALTERERVERELGQIGERLAELERARQALVPQVPPETLTVYEQVLHIREGLALVPLMSDSCGGCHRRLPPQIINQVYLKAKLVTCENCNRILYFDEAHSKL
jgi:predicted  nucleic acid-binding Zn-ribbon protein